jgi:hypothetical protein
VLAGFLHLNACLKARPHVRDSSLVLDQHSSAGRLIHAEVPHQPSGKSPRLLSRKGLFDNIPAQRWIIHATTISSIIYSLPTSNLSQFL